MEEMKNGDVQCIDDGHNSTLIVTKFDMLPEEVIANICSCFVRNTTTNLVERNLKKQKDFSANSLFEDEELDTVTIDDLIDIYPLSLLNRTFRNKILNNNHLWNEKMIVDLSDFSKSTKLFKYMNKINDWNYNSSDHQLIVAVERERLNIALKFLSCLGLSDYIKKLKVSCILKEVGEKEQISWSNLIIESFPSLTDLIYYSLTDRNAIQRYETLDCSQSRWENLSTIRVYFDFNSLLSLLNYHKSTVNSISFAPRVSDRQSIEKLLKNSDLLENVSSINIDMKFDFSKLESNKNYLNNFGALIIDCFDSLDILTWLPRLSHLQRIVLERITSTTLEIADIDFINLSELLIGFEHQSNIIFKNVNAPQLKEIGVCNASIDILTAPFANLRSIKFSNCEYDMNFWISSHPTLRYLSLVYPEIPMRGKVYSRSFSLSGNQSLLCISLFLLESVCVKDINPACKLYLEKCVNIEIDTKKVSEIYMINTYPPCKISIRGENCSKLHLPKLIETCKIDLKAINDFSCYYINDYMKILPVSAHNISLETLHISCFESPVYLQDFLTSFKHIRICKCMISSEHTFSKVFYNVSPSSSIGNDMENHEKIITHGDIPLHHYLEKCTSLNTLISGRKLNCASNTKCLSNSLTHLEASVKDFSSMLVFPNLKELILTHSENIDIDLSEYPHLQDFSISYSTNVTILHTSNIMERMKFFMLDSISTLSITIDNVKAPNLREAIIHSIKSIKDDTVPTFSLSFSPKLLFYYVSFIWKPAFKPNPINHPQPTPPKISNENTKYCQLL